MCDYAHSRVSAADRARCGFNVGRLIFRRAPKTLLHLLHLLQLRAAPSQAPQRLVYRSNGWPMNNLTRTGRD